jgi:hypothetical protein
MSTATNHHTTPTRRSALGFSAAAIVAGFTVPAIAGVGVRGATLTPIASLQGQLSALGKRHNVMDRALARMPPGPEHDALAVAFSQSLTDGLALQDEILALPAENLEDAAIQVTISYYRIEEMSSYTLPDEIEDLSKELRFLQASILLAIVKAAKLDIDSLGWGEMRRLCAKHGPQGRIAA